MKSKLHYRGRIAQIGIYLGKLLRMFVYQSDWKVIPMSALIAGLVVYAVGQNMFVNQEGAFKGGFALICVCIWNGFFNSIQSVCRERDIIKREHRSGMHISSYIAAHMIYQILICLIQTVITIAVCMLAGIELPKSGLITPVFLVDFGITLFLVTYTADIMSLMISCIVNDTTTAMTVMPFMLIIQLIFSGGIFELTGAAAGLTALTISNWGLRAVCTLGNYNSLPMITLWNTIFMFRDFEIEGIKPVEMVTNFVMDNNAVEYVTQQSGLYCQKPAYVYEASNMMSCWSSLIIMILVFAIVAVISLEFIDRDKR